MPIHWFARMARWARKPPTWKQVKFVLVVIAICLAIWGLEQVFGLPGEWEPVRPPVRLR